MKTWVEGTCGDQVVDNFLAGGMIAKKAMSELLKLATKIRDQGAYIGDFRPPNLIWDGHEWFIVDSGGINQGLTLQEAEQKWLSQEAKGVKFERRWKIKLQFQPVSCNSLLGKAG